MASMTKDEQVQKMISIFERYDSCIRDLASLGYYNDADVVSELRKNLLGRLMVVSGDVKEFAL